MIRKLFLPAVAIALLGGCMTGGYNYRQDRGDYYYGQPSTEYRYYGSPYGGYYDRYGAPGYQRYPYGYGGYYNQPFYNNPYYNHPYYPYRPRPPVVVVPRPDDDNTPPPPPRPDDGNSDRRPPWRDPNHFRNLDNLRRQHSDNPAPQTIAPAGAAAIPVPARAVRVMPSRNEGASRPERVMRRVRDRASSSEADK